MATKQEICQAGFQDSLANSSNFASIWVIALTGPRLIAPAGGVCLKLVQTDDNTMTAKPSFLSELQDKIHQVLQQSPARDVEKNLRAMLNQGFSKLDLLTREEFEVQAEVLARTRTRLEALEKRVAELEAQQKD